MTLTVWGRKTSINVQKVIWALTELNLPYERIDAGGAFGGNDTEDYLAMNPTGLVPTLVDGDLVMGESNAILRYLVDAYGAGRLQGASPKARAADHMWFEWYQANVYPHFQAIFHQRVRLPESERDAVAFEKSFALVAQHFAVFDARLEGQAFITGDDLTLGDFPMAACLYRYYTMDLDHPDLPNLARYYTALCNRTAYRDTVMINYDSLRAKDA